MDRLWSGTEAAAAGDSPSPTVFLHPTLTYMSYASLVTSRKGCKNATAALFTSRSTGPTPPSACSVASQSARSTHTVSTPGHCVYYVVRGHIYQRLHALERVQLGLSYSSERDCVFVTFQSHRGSGLGVSGEPVTFLGLPGCCREGLTWPVGNSAQDFRIRDLAPLPASLLPPSAQVPLAQQSSHFCLLLNPGGIVVHPRVRRGEGVLRVLDKRQRPAPVFPSLAALSSPLLPPGLGQRGSYFADQAVQVGLGPAHGHHSRARRV